MREHVEYPSASIFAPDLAAVSRAKAGLRGFLSEHWLICSLVIFATIVRILVMLAYPPAFWYPDSMAYIQAAVNPVPNNFRPNGYPFLLMFLGPAHSVLLIILAQHAMGVVIGVQIYRLLRRHMLPPWAAAIAAVPPLISAYTIEIEHYVLADTFFGLLVTTAVCLMLGNPRPRVWVCGLTGLLLALATLVRSQGILLIILFVLYVVVAHLGLRRSLLSVAAMCAAFLVPVLSYCAWYDASYGTFQMTTGTGSLLYSRVALFADCAVIKPPADERWLCISTPVGRRETSAWYMWSTQSPLAHGPAPAWSILGNRLTTNYAERAIIAQPAAYLREVWDATIEAFMPGPDTNGTQKLYRFPASMPPSVITLGHQLDENPAFEYQYNGGHDPSTRTVRPFSKWLQSYQQNFALPGVLLGMIVLVGLTGAILGWRHGGAMWLAWMTGLVLIVTPAATADYDARYVVAGIPAFCIAGALGAREIRHRVSRVKCMTHLSSGGSFDINTI